MIDKINRLEQPASISGKIEYGDGNVYFKTTGEVAAFEIDYVGSMQAINKLGDGWSIKAGRNKIVVYSLAETPLTSLLFTYIGELKITKCVFVTWNLKKHHANIIYKDNSSWNKSLATWSSDTRKHEEVLQKKIIKKQIKKSVI